jgi:hypothetical protein
VTARKTSAAPTRIWTYHAMAPATGRDIVAQVGRDGQRYYNALVAIERARHERFCAIRSAWSPELGAAEASSLACAEATEALFARVRRSRGAEFAESGGKVKRALLTEDERAELAIIDERQRAIHDAAKELRAEFAALIAPGRDERKRRSDREGTAPRIKERVNAEVLAEMLAEPDWSAEWKRVAESDADALAARKALRAEYATRLATPATYLRIEDAVDRAKKDRSPLPPRFRSADGRVSIVAQGRKDSTFASLCAGGVGAMRLRHTALDGDPRYWTLEITTRADETITVPIKIHRRPPADALVKWVSLHGWRQGERMRWELQITLEAPSFAAPNPAYVPREDAAALGHVRTRWARVDGGVMIAELDDDPIVLPDAILNQATHAASIRAAADKHLDRVARALRLIHHAGGWRFPRVERLRRRERRLLLRRVCIESAERDGSAAHWAAWLAERRSRGEDLFAPLRITREWMVRRCGGTSSGFALSFWLYTWARKDSHLRQYEADSTRRFEARREAFFRAEVGRIARSTERITVDTVPIARLRERAPVATSDEPRGNRAIQYAAPGAFREMLREVMGERASDAPKAAPARTKKTKEVREMKDRQATMTVARRTDARKATDNAAE